MTRALTALIAIVLVGGCVFGPTVECDDTGWERDVTCDDVVAAAQSQIVGSGITRLTVQQGLHCPTDGHVSCPLTPAVFTVYADLADGRRLAVMVDADEGGAVRARSPEAVETGQ